MSMTYRPIDANNWIARQPKTVQEAGEARGAELVREVTLRKVRDTRASPSRRAAQATRSI